MRFHKFCFNFSGLIRANENSVHHAIQNMGESLNQVIKRSEVNNRQRSMNPLSANEPVEEEKQQRDSSATEKKSNHSMHLPVFGYPLNNSSTNNSLAVSR